MDFIKKWLKTAFIVFGSLTVFLCLIDTVFGIFNGKLPPVLLLIFVYTLVLTFVAYKLTFIAVKNQLFFFVIMSLIVGIGCVVLSGLAVFITKGTLISIPRCILIFIESSAFCFLFNIVSSLVMKHTMKKINNKLREKREEAGE